jgi:DUF3102 family protein
MQDRITDLPTALDLVGEADSAETAVDTIAASNDVPGDVVLPGSDVVVDSTLVPAVAATGFDYATVAIDLAVDLLQAADRAWKLAHAGMIEIGRELLTVKDRLEHGQFVAWVQYECQMPIRSVERAMRAAEMVEKNDNLSYLPADGLLALGARSSPKAAVAEIRRRIDAGERPTAAEIKREIEDAKWQAKRAAEEATMSARRRKAKTQRQVKQTVMP